MTYRATGKSTINEEVNKKIVYAEDQAK